LFIRTAGIYANREFYCIYEEKDDVGIAQYLSILFWQPGLIFDQSGKALIHFLTGDITGDFRVVVQGMVVWDVIFGRNHFTVS